MSNGFVLRVVEGTDVGSSTSVELPIVVGREGDLVVADPTVSRKHCGSSPGASPFTSATSAPPPAWW